MTIDAIKDIAGRVGLYGLVLLMGLAAGVYLGDERRAALDRAELADIQRQAAEDREAASERYREAERAAQRQVDAIKLAKQEETENAKKQMDVLRDELRTGAVRLSVAVDALSAARAAAAADAGDTEARADLLPEIAQRILDLAEEGGGIVRDLNACVDQYRVVEGVYAEFIGAVLSGKAASVPAEK